MAAPSLITAPAQNCGDLTAAAAEHQKAVTIRNDVNVRKESVRVVEDEKNSGTFLLSFIFDAVAPGRYFIGLNTLSSLRLYRISLFHALFYHRSNMYLFFNKKYYFI